MKKWHNLYEKINLASFCLISIKHKLLNIAQHRVWPINNKFPFLGVLPINFRVYHLELGFFGTLIGDDHAKTFDLAKLRNIYTFID